MNNYKQVFYLVNDGVIELLSRDKNVISERIASKCVHEQKKCVIKTVTKKYNPNGSKIKISNFTEHSLSEEQQKAHIPIKNFVHKKQKCSYCLCFFIPVKIKQVTCGKQKCMHEHQIYLEKKWREQHEEYNKNWVLRHRQAKYLGNIYEMPKTLCPK